MGKRKGLVTGSGGQLGGAICAEFSAEALVPLTHAELDLVDHGNLLKGVTAHNPSIIINCAGYNRVDEAENNAEMALAVNAFGVRSLARAAPDVGAIFVHYRTDFVFDGVATVPYTEQDEASPRNVYGTSKLIGEWFASDIMGAYILRVESLFGGTPARSSIDQITDAVANGREPNVFMDRVVSPSFVHDVARATRSLSTRRRQLGFITVLILATRHGYPLPRKSNANFDRQHPLDQSLLLVCRCQLFGQYFVRFPIRSLPRRVSQCLPGRTL